MSKLPGLTLKKRGYFLHRRYPRDIAHHFGTTFLSETLQTRDYDEAVRRYHRRMAELEEEWAELRSWTPERLGSAREIIRLGQLWDWGEALILQEEVPERAVTGYATGDLPLWLIRLIADRNTFLTEDPEQGRALKAAGPDWEVREHARLALRNMIRNDGTEYLDWLKVRRGELKRDGFEGSPLPMSPSRFEGLVTKRKTSAPRKNGMRALSDVLEAWRAERAPTEKTYDEYKAKIRRFEEVHPNLTIGVISKADVSDFMEQLRQIPAHLSNADSTKPVPDLVGKYRDQPCQKVSQKTIKKHVDCIRTMLRFALDKGWIEINRLDGFKVAQPTSQPKRQPFNASECAKIIRHCSQYEDERFWLPVLALYTGARLNELGQLRTNDVRESDEMTYIAITNEDGKRTKNAGSVRNIPLHQDVLKAGFMDYVSSAGDGPLFPNLKPDAYGNLTSSYSKQFGRDLRTEIGVTDKQKVFHSFRHTFKDLCREFDIPQDVHDQITGHHDKSASAGYGIGHSMRTLNRWLQKIETGIQIQRKNHQI